MGEVLPIRRPDAPPRPELRPDLPEPHSESHAEPDAAPGLEPLWRTAVGEQLRAERTARAERLVDVAGRAGVSTQYLSELERGRKEPSSEVLAALAGALELSVADLASRATRRLSASVALRGPVCLAA